MNTRRIGTRGEDLAVKKLISNKYKILERNFSCKFGEVDIIAQKDNYIVFVEVKSRSNDKFGLPREAVDLRKQQTIAKCAVYWMSVNGMTGRLARFDVAEVVGDEVVILQDAFRI